MACKSRRLEEMEKYKEAQKVYRRAAIRGREVCGAIKEYGDLVHGAGANAGSHGEVSRGLSLNTVAAPRR